jgi:predicted nucleotidyltransferase
MDYAQLLEKVRQRMPDLLAFYAFGSQVGGTADRQSDLDLAILRERPSDAYELWSFAGELADLAGCAVDLVDLGAASTVLQYQVITSGTRIWAKDQRAALYESFILSEKTALDTARAGLLEDIRREGSVHGR